MVRRNINESKRQINLELLVVLSNRDIDHQSTSTGLPSSVLRLPQPDAVVVMPFAQDKDFVGREDILTSLEKGFSQPTTLRRMALVGLGGIG